MNRSTTTARNRFPAMKVLVVEDDSVSRMKMERLLLQAGYRTTMAANGREGFAAWKRERPRIVITDWMMPEMDGLELCRRIRAATVEDYTYIIFVTGNDQTQDLIAGMDAGADDYIRKPFQKQEVIVRVRAGERVINLHSKETVIFALAKLAESRDKSTGGHLDRVRHYSRVLAETLQQMADAPAELDDLLIEHIFLTSSLHDIGKVGIPDYILLKPDRLDDGEFEIMKSHTRIGFETLSEALHKTPGADYLKVAAEIAGYHHEKFDGTGYPEGLRGYDIPISCRIFTLCDVYDTLVSHRPYKINYSHDRARSIIVDGAGSHFDPMVVDAFLACEERFCHIYG
jgi:putative two-component system response regulator